MRFDRTVVSAANDRSHGSTRKQRPWTVQLGIVRLGRRLLGTEDTHVKALSSPARLHVGAAI